MKSYRDTMNAYRRIKSYMTANNELSEHLKLYVSRLFDTIVEFTPVDEGDTKDAWELERMGSTTWMIFNPLQSALFVEYSSQPHTIVPKNKEALYFKVGGAEVFASRIEHPGVKDPAAPVRRALEKRKELLKRMEDEVLEGLVDAWRKQ